MSVYLCYKCKTFALIILVFLLARIINFKHSSVYSERKMCHSKYVADRFFSKVWEEGIFISNNIGYPWLQLEFDEVIAVHRIVYFDRSTACGHRFSNVFFHVGNSSSLIGWDGTSTDPECYHFTGTSMEYSVHDFKCTETNHGRFLVVQMRQSNYLQIAELLVFDDPGFNIHLLIGFIFPDHILFQCIQCLKTLFFRHLAMTLIRQPMDLSGTCSVILAFKLTSKRIHGFSWNFRLLLKLYMWSLYKG